jgi:hypothetical protein
MSRFGLHVSKTVWITVTEAEEDVDKGEEARVIRRGCGRWGWERENKGDGAGRV